MPVLDVAAGIVLRDGHLLITQRPPGVHLAGLWEFPGGKLQTGEDWECALHRELREELDIAVRILALFEEVLHPYPEKTVRLRFYLCALESGEPRPIECAQLAWVTPEELSRYPFPPADAQLIRRLQANPGITPSATLE